MNNRSPDQRAETHQEDHHTDGVQATSTIIAQGFYPQWSNGTKPQRCLPTHYPGQSQHTKEPAITSKTSAHVSIFRRVPPYPRRCQTTCFRMVHKNTGSVDTERSSAWQCYQESRRQLFACNEDLTNGVSIGCTGCGIQHLCL